MGEHDRIPRRDGGEGDACYHDCRVCYAERSAEACAARPAFDERMAMLRHCAQSGPAEPVSATDVVPLCDEIERLRDALKRIADVTIVECADDGDNIATDMANDARATLGMSPVPEKR